VLYQLSCNYSLFVNLPQKGLYTKVLIGWSYKYKIRSLRILFRHLLVEEMKKVLYVTLSGQRNNEYYSIWSGVNLKGAVGQVCVKGALLCKSLMCVRYRYSRCSLLFVPCCLLVLYTKVLIGWCYIVLMISNHFSNRNRKVDIGLGSYRYILGFGLASFIGVYFHLVFRGIIL